LPINLTTLKEHACFGGTVGFYAPPQVSERPGPALFYLAGLTSTEETFMTKGGAQRVVAEHGLMLVAPDTSPRGIGLPGEDKDWDFGSGAGFYLDATAEP
jgi:S-formylglutathione hydrolase